MESSHKTFTENSCGQIDQLKRSEEEEYFKAGRVVVNSKNISLDKC